MNFREIKYFVKKIKIKYKYADNETIENKENKYYEKMQTFKVANQ